MCLRHAGKGGGSKPPPYGWRVIPLSLRSQRRSVGCGNPFPQYLLLGEKVSAKLTDVGKSGVCNAMGRAGDKSRRFVGTFLSLSQNLRFCQLPRQREPEKYRPLTCGQGPWLPCVRGVPAYHLCIARRIFPRTFAQKQKIRPWRADLDPCKRLSQGWIYAVPVERSQIGHHAVPVGPVGHTVPAGGGVQHLHRHLALLH